VFELLKKSVLTGIGLALKTREEAEDLVKEIINQGELSEQEGRKFLEDLLQRYDESRMKLEDRIEKSVREFLKKADVVTGDELKALKKEIRDLKKTMSQETDDSTS
jgi:polyhydroxyalkanoate synthesis regulator phasin